MRQPFLPLIALLAILALLPAGPYAQAGPGGQIAPTHFSPSSLSRYCNTSFPPSGLPAICAEGPVSETLTAGTPHDTTISFSIPWGHMNSSQVVASTPPDAFLAPSGGVGGLPLGAVVGKLRFGTTLGESNSPCNPLGNETGTLETNYTLLNATTQTNLMIEPFPLADASGREGAAEVYRDDIDGNGLPEHVDKYPAYLNKLFDPDRNGDINGDGDAFDVISEATAETAVGLDLNADGDTTDAADLNGDGDTADAVAENPGAFSNDPFGTVEPLVPLARYSANALVAGSAVAIELVTFEPGQLQAFASPHPFSEIAPEYGYPTVVVLADPTQPFSPSLITDSCTPLTTLTVLWGTTRDNPCTPNAAPGSEVLDNDGFGCANRNLQCAVDCGNNLPINENVTVCSNEADDDGDAAANDGCPAVGLAEAACNDNGGVLGADSDNDTDRFVDDGCPVVAVTSELACAVCSDGLKTTGGEAGATRAANPPAATGIHGSGTHLTISHSASLRDSDGDGYENHLDTCKEDVNTDPDPRIGNGVDGDMIDPICDPTPTLDSGAGNQDGDTNGFPASGWLNGQDNCPAFPNDSQRETDRNVPRTRSAPYGGTNLDDTGDACEGAESGIECTGAVDNDGDGAVNDGCPPRGPTGGAAEAETGAQCANEANDDGANDLADPVPGSFINDGCPTRATAARFLVANGHFHYHMEITAKCIGGTDRDRDGYCNSLEDSLGSIDANVGNPGNQTGCESARCGQDGAGLTGAGGREAGAQCAGAADDDADGFVNDGCPQDGATREMDLIGDAQCQDAADDDNDTVVNDGCFPAGRGSCSDGADNDGDGFTDALDAGCRIPEDRALDFPAPLANLGAGPDADGDGVPDHDEPSATPDNDALDTAGGQQEEPHGVCNDDIDQDADASRDANATLNGGGADASATDSGCADLALDGDRDGLVDASDNCDAAFNPSQRNTDGDPDGDACDTNDDGDAQTDAAERACGSRALNSASVCEMGGNGTDDDRDGSVDESAVPSTLNIVNFTAAAGPAGDRWANHDRDGDGWTLLQERLLGTAPNVVVGNPVDNDPCGGVGLATDGWPADLAGATNRMDIGDIVSFTSPGRTGDNTGTPPGSALFNMFTHALDDDGDTVIESAEAPDNNGGVNDPPTFNVRRWNLQVNIPHLASTKIDIGDMGALINGLIGAPARPPMFGGQLAFFSASPTGRCPFAP